MSSNSRNQLDSAGAIAPLKSLDPDRSRLTASNHAQARQPLTRAQAHHLLKDPEHLTYTLKRQSCKRETANMLLRLGVPSAQKKKREEAAKLRSQLGYKLRAENLKFKNEILAPKAWASPVASGGLAQSAASIESTVNFDSIEQPHAEEAVVTLPVKPPAPSIGSHSRKSSSQQRHS